MAFCALQKLTGSLETKLFDAAELLA
uniref:Uncharacterized protein n=1 Tax=Anguilla anguilla TaxID=7936 RepID=A0A0E9T4M7_ANGAN